MTGEAHCVVLLFFSKLFILILKKNTILRDQPKLISIIFFSRPHLFDWSGEARRLSEIAIKVLDEKIAESNRVVTPYFLIEMQTLT